MREMNGGGEGVNVLEYFFVIKKIFFFEFEFTDRNFLIKPEQIFPDSLLPTYYLSLLNI